MYLAHRSTTDPRRFFLYEQYDDQAALDAHRAAPHFEQYVKQGLFTIIESRSPELSNRWRISQVHGDHRGSTESSMTTTTQDSERPRPDASRPAGRLASGQHARLHERTRSGSSAGGRAHGDIVKLRLGNLRTYVLVHPAHIEYVLRTHHDEFIKDKLTQTISPLVGQGLLTSEGAYWRRQRRLAQPTFQHQQIQRYAGQMVELTRRMLRPGTTAKCASSMPSCRG